MARQEINLGTAPTGVGGDTTRTAGVKINAMTDEIYKSFYQLSNILADVADLGGIPNGGIIETKTNSNGTYTKFADGTLICFNTFIVTATVNPGASVVPSVVMPYAFSGSPYIANSLIFYTAGQGSQIYSSKQNYGLIGAFINTGVSASASFPSFTTLGSNIAYSYEYRYLAIGRWK